MHAPGSETGCFIAAGGLRWHLQRAGSGPLLLLLHGTGAAAHSWRALLPPLAQDFTVVAPDLPGHGATSALAREHTTLPGMAAALGALMSELGLQPSCIAGHSAGAAIAAQMALSPHSPVHSLAWINPALLPFDRWPGLLFTPLARWMAAQRWLPRLAAWHANDGRAVQRLIAGTGSTLDAQGVDHYRRLLSQPAHVSGALAMMAGWDLAPLAQALPRLQQPVLVIVGDADRTVPPAQMARAAATLQQAELLRLPGLGHLAHEERPLEVAAALRRWFSRAGPPR